MAEFQVLIGRLVTILYTAQRWNRVEFQVLIGRLVTEGKKALFEFLNGCFKSL